MNPIAAGIGAALISGVAMYTVGAKTAQVDAFTPMPASEQRVDAQFVPASYTTALRPVAVPAIATTSAPAITQVHNTRRTSAPQRSVTRSTNRRVVDEREIA